MLDQSPRLWPPECSLTSFSAVQERYFSARAVLGPESASGTSIFLIADGILQIVMNADPNASSRSTDSGSAGSVFDEDKTGREAVCYAPERRLRMPPAMSLQLQRCAMYFYVHTMRLDEVAGHTNMATWGAGMMSAKSISEMVAETPRPEIHDNGRVVIETAGPGDFVGKAAIAGRSRQAPLITNAPELT